VIDKYRRRVFLKYELKRLVLKSVTKSESLPYAVRYFALYKRNHVLRFAAVIEQRNRCIVTGRVWNVLQKVRYSRFFFRTEAYHGNIPGCRKAS